MVLFYHSQVFTPLLGVLADIMFIKMNIIIVIMKPNAVIEKCVQAISRVVLPSPLLFTLTLPMKSGLETFLSSVIIQRFKFTLTAFMI
jgi:hypothetical protein